MHERGLARARRPHNRDELTPAHVEAHAAQSVHGHIPGAVHLGHVADLDKDVRLGFRCPPNRHYGVPPGVVPRPPPPPWPPPEPPWPPRCPGRRLPRTAATITRSPS